MVIIKFCQFCTIFQLEKGNSLFLAIQLLFINERSRNFLKRDMPMHPVHMLNFVPIDASLV